MESNKKENNEEKVKIYDKEMYISQEKLKTIVIIIIIFVIGFIAGYFSGLVTTNESHIETENQIANVNIDTVWKFEL